MFFIDSPDTIYEGESHWLRAVAQQDGYPEGQNLEYMWASLGTTEDFGFPYPYPPDTVASWSAERQPGEVPPYERTIRAAVYDGLGGTDYFDLGPFLVYERPCVCGDPWGDLDCNGNINPVDVVYIVNLVYLLNDMRCYPEGWHCPYDLGDVNCDGFVNPVDVVYYQQRVYMGNNMFCPDPCTQ